MYPFPVRRWDIRAAGTEIAPYEDSMKPFFRALARPLTFQTKLLLVFVVLLSVVMTLLGFIHYQFEKVMLRKSVGNLRNMVNVVHYSTQSLSTERPLSRKEVDHFLSEIIRKESAIEASLVDFDHLVVASTNPGKVGSISPLPSDSIGVWGPLEDAKEQPGMVRYDVRIPLVRHKQVEGIVEISVFLHDLRSYLRSFNWEQFILVLAAMSAAFLLFSVFLKRLHKPFVDLAEAAKRVANGDFSARLAGGEKGEEAEMASAFNHMAKQLLEQRQMEERLFALERRAILSELGANLAHEIRNPLNILNLSIHHIGKTYKPDDAAREEGFQKLIASCKNEVQHLNGIVTDFLSLGKPSQLSRKRFKVKELVSEVAIRLHQQIGIKGLRLDVECPDDIEAEADPERMRLAILNLILNSVDIVPPGSAIVFSAERDKSTGGIRCSVSDQGPGIAGEDLEHVFEPYFTKRAGGMGLGLTLVRRIVEEHGGEIKAMNREEGGAEFLFTVPAGA
jgi:signal transduction histidine kinase